jgi:RNA recognition motif-containing protein
MQNVVWHNIGGVAAAVLAGFLAGLLTGQKVRFPRKGAVINNDRPFRTPELYVGNLPDDANEGGIRRHFEKYGQVRDVRLISGRAGEDGPKTFAFLTMGNPDMAQAAALGTNGREFEGRKLVVNEARSRRRHSRR